MEDLWFRQLMLGDEDTMAYNHAWGGTIDFPQQYWADWYNYWLANTEGKRYYRYVKNEVGDFVGEIAYHYDDELQGYTANVIVYAKYRKQGYGGQALDALCDAAKQRGIDSLYDDIAIDNSAIKLFIQHGFVEQSRTQDKIILKKCFSPNENIEL